MSNPQAVAIAGRMGKPPLPMTIRPTKVQLSDELLARIDKVVGGTVKYQRSKFIREAVEAELARRERQKS